VIAPWLGQVFEPTNYKRKKGSSDGPDTNLELSWAFGYTAEGARNNVRYIGGVGVEYNDRLIVYYTAALGVVYSPKTRTQSFYMGHSDAITCIALHPGNQIVATGDVRSNIHIWNMDPLGKVTHTPYLNPPSLYDTHLLNPPTLYDTHLLNPPSLYDTHLHLI
jgi:hypothetical protein